jgi:hypothetical protein
LLLPKRPTIFFTYNPALAASRLNYGVDMTGLVSRIYFNAVIVERRERRGSIDG